MTIWFLTNIVLTFFALLFIWTNSTSPYRLRFMTGFTALCAWLVPWNLVEPFFPKAVAFDQYQMTRILSANIPEILTTPIGITSSISSSVDNSIPSELLLIDLMGVFLAIATIGGIFAFVFCCYRQNIFLSNLRKSALPGNYLLGQFSNKYSQFSDVPKVDIYIQDKSPGAICSGVLFPKIWIHHELVSDSALPVILLHEINHIKQNDNFYLLLITFIEKIFWWNPLIHVLSKQSRILQELSCDEFCAESVPDYRSILSSLILANQDRISILQKSSLSSNILKENSFNILRIRLLEKRCVMKFKHLMNLLLTFCAALVSVSIVTAQTSEFSLNEFEKDSLMAVGSSRSVSSGEPTNISYMVSINKNAEFSMYYPDAHLITILTAMVDMQRGLRARRNVDKSTGAPKPDTEYGLRLEVAETLNIGSRKINDTDAYGVMLPSGRFANLSLEETLSLLSVQSNCTIFKDQDAIVVDQCGG